MAITRREPRRVVKQRGAVIRLGDERPGARLGLRPGAGNEQAAGDIQLPPASVQTIDENAVVLQTVGSMQPQEHFGSEK